MSVVKPTRQHIVKAKKQIKDLLAKERTMDYIGMLDKLDIELDVMVLACDELEAEGKIAESITGDEMSVVKPSRKEIVKAKTQIKDLLEKERTMDYIGMLDRLDIDLVVMVMACEELEAEGKIEGVD
jgi:hypothetical protein